MTESLSPYPHLLIITDVTGATFVIDWSDYSYAVGSSSDVTVFTKSGKTIVIEVSVNEFITGVLQLFKVNDTKTNHP